jgi:hypothetical protein
MKTAAPTMEHQVNAFLASMESRPEYSASTRLAYASDLRVFLDYLQTSLQRPPELGDLTPEQIAFLQAEARRRRQTTYAPSDLRSFSRYLAGLGGLPAMLRVSIVSSGVDRPAQAAPVLKCLSEAQVSRPAVIEDFARPARRISYPADAPQPVSAGALVPLIRKMSTWDRKLCPFRSKWKFEARPARCSCPARWTAICKKEAGAEPRRMKSLFISQMNSRLSRQ